MVRSPAPPARPARRMVLVSDLRRVPGGDHLADEFLVAGLDVPVQRLRPPVGQGVRIGAVDGDLKCVCHGSQYEGGPTVARHAVDARISLPYV